MGKLNGKVALVTGGGSGIGRAAALAFAAEGARVVVADVVVQGGEETVRMITQKGGEAIFVKTDVSRAAEVEALVRKAVDTFGRLDCAANNAGINGQTQSLTDCTEENWDRVIGIDLKGVWLCMKYEIPEMLKHGGGAIVNTASIAGLVMAGTAPYTAAKHGVIGLTKVAAAEYGSQGIRANAVCPGVIRTPMTEPLLKEMPEVINMMTAASPMGRLGEADEIGRAIVWLCTPEASCITGAALPVDGGYVIR